MASTSVIDFGVKGMHGLGKNHTFKINHSFLGL